MDSKTQKAFTLIELLVVIAVIGLLASVVLVNLQSSRGKARIAAGQQFDSHLQSTLGAYATGIWRFEEGTGTVATDESGNGNNGQLRNGVSRVSNATLGGNALSFNGVNDFVSVPYNAANDLPKGTIAMWINFPVSAGGYFFSKQHNGVNSFLIFGVTGGLLQFQVQNQAGYTIGKTSLSANRWYHVVATWNGTSQKVYLNGVEDGSKATTVVLGSDTSPISVGAWTGDGNSYANVIIDDVRIYGSALSIAEIEKLYQLTYR